MKKNKTSSIKFLLPYLAVAAIVLIIIFNIKPSGNAKSIEYPFTKLVQDVENDNRDFEQIKITPRQTIIVINGSYITLEDGKEISYRFKITILNNAENQGKINSMINSGNIEYTINDIYESNLFIDIMLQLIPYALILLVAVFLLNRFASSATGGNNKAFDFGKSRANLSHGSRVRFSDVAGSQEEKAELIELVDYLKHPEKFAKMGAKFPKGVILQGSPGTGKTLLAKAVAGEADVPFYFISGSDFVEMFVGVGASRVRDMFKTAKNNRPCIVFIDEIDAVGRQRGAGLGGGNDEREQTLNQLLVELDGFEENSGILVIAATNRPDVLDPALLRPGRFDRQITVALPDKQARIEILKVHARNKNISKSVNFENIAQRTPGFSGAQLSSVINEASILAVRRNKDIITPEEIDEAIDRVIGGPARKSKVITPHEKELIAYHEAGHAVIGLKLEHSNIVQKVTIIPRGDSGGYVLMTPKNDQTLMTKGELIAKITGYLGGRVSEEIFFNDVTTGAQNDIEQATRIARIMVTELGMSNLGPIQYEKDSGSVFLGRDYISNGRRFSGQVAYEIDKEVRSIIDCCYQKAIEIVKKHKDLLTLIAQTLLNKETLTAEEIKELEKSGNLDAFNVQEQENQNLENSENTEDSSQDISNNSEEEK